MSGAAGPVQITGFTKVGGPLTKRISLAADGTIKSDGSACVMSRGEAERVRISDIAGLGTYVDRLNPHQAIALGALRPGLPNRVQVVTKQKLNGISLPNIIARTGSYIRYPAGTPALALIDFDTKGMPGEISARLAQLGGCWPALLEVAPELHTVAHITRASTSAGLFRTDTGAKVPGSAGLHIYIPVHDGADVERFLKTLHARCWLAGLGWMMVGAGGQLLERSIVDRMVGAPERLVFEGAPVLEPPLAQDQEARRPVITEGGMLDTAAVCPPLTVLQKSKLHELQTKEALRLAPERAKVRAAFIDEQTKRLVSRTGMSAHAAAEVIARQCDGLLLPSVVLPFDDEELAGATVADVIADPLRFEAATLADPLEGPEYGICKARIMCRIDGRPWIHSFAHGRTVYELRLDIDAVRAALEKAPKEAMIDTLVKLALAAELDDDELEELRNLAAERTGITKRTITRRLKNARAQQAAADHREKLERQLAQRLDPRPQLEAPPIDSPWIPQMTTIDEALGSSKAAVPPARDIEGSTYKHEQFSVPELHAFTREESNQMTESSRLPAPQQWVLRRMNEMEVAEMIESHIDYVDKEGRSVHLPMPFVRHFMRRKDSLPVVSAITTLPLVLADGGLLAPDGLDRLRGIIFKIPDELRKFLPKREECTEGEVANAMRFLCEEWLADVATNCVGKAILVALALTIIERSLMPDRPTFFVTAGRRGGGKTTTLSMLIMAVTGILPAAAAWSPNDEERRKALLSYLLYGLAYILWDNIPRGTQISCPHIEKSCTAAFYTDRKLGVSEAVATSAATIHLFTGNNIAPKGDLASRSLIATLELDRHDPENREFTHPDPIGWTEDNRGKILRALYTILLANPQLKAARNAAGKTRFKMWWRLVGSAVEHAVKQAKIDARELGELKGKDGKPKYEDVDFSRVFLDQETDDEEAAGLTGALEAMLAEKSIGIEFTSAKLATLLNADQAPDSSASVIWEFLFPSRDRAKTVTPKSVGRMLSKHLNAPVLASDGKTTLILKNKGGKERLAGLTYHVDRKAS